MVTVAWAAKSGPVLDVSQRAAQQAGFVKWSQRHNGHGMGLADAMIYETAREHGLRVVTGDEGFKGLPDVDMLASRAGKG